MKKLYLSLYLILSIYSSASLISCESKNSNKSSEQNNFISVERKESFELTEKQIKRIKNHDENTLVLDKAIILASRQVANASWFTNWQLIRELEEQIKLTKKLKARRNDYRNLLLVGKATSNKAKAMNLDQERITAQINAYNNGYEININ